VTIDTIVSETHPENYETDINEKEVLRSQEWSIHLFCIKLFDLLTHNLHREPSVLINICEILNNLFVIMNEARVEWSNLNLVN
jgi:hypothetical protein